MSELKIGDTVRCSNPGHRYHGAVGKVADIWNLDGRQAQIEIAIRLARAEMPATVVGKPEFWLPV